MSDSFFERPILNSPYEYPARHWELDEDGQPTERIVDQRRRVSFITPIPKPEEAQGGEAAQSWSSTRARASRPRSSSTTRPSIINEVRSNVDSWRRAGTRASGR